MCSQLAANVHIDCNGRVADSGGQWLCLLCMRDMACKLVLSSVQAPSLQA